MNINIKLLAVEQFMVSYSSFVSQYVIMYWILSGNNYHLLQLSFFTVVSFFPSILAAPLLGFLADKISAKKSLIITDLVAIVAILFILLYYFNNKIVFLYTGGIIRSLADCYQLIAINNSIKISVAKSKLTAANSIILTGQNSGLLLASITSGILFSTVKIPFIILIEFIVYMISILILMNLKLTKINDRKYVVTISNQIESSSLIYSVKYIFKTKNLFCFLMFLLLVNFFFTSALLLWQKYALTLFYKGDYSVLECFFQFGIISGALLLPTLFRNVKLFYLLFFSSFSLAFSISATGILQIFIFLLVIKYITGFVISLLNGAAQTIWLGNVPVCIQGKIFAIRYFLFNSIRTIAIIFTGYISDKYFNDLTINLFILKTMLTTTSLFTLLGFCILICSFLSLKLQALKLN